MRLIEPFAVLDTYADAIAKIEKLKGGNVRVTFTVSGHDEKGRPANVIVAKIVVAQDELTERICH